MAITWAVTPFKQTVFGDQRVVYATLVATGTYTSGGDTVQASSFGLDVFDLASVEGVVTSAGGTTGFLSVCIANFPATSFKLQLFGGAASGVALAEPSGSLTGAVCAIEVRGA